MNTKHTKQTGAISASMVVASVLGLFMLVFAGLAVWAYLGYNDQKTNVDYKIAIAEADAKKKQAADDQDNYTKQLENPYIEFVGPDDFGRVTFDYPKTWSAFVAKNNTKSGDYEAYLNPGTIPPLGKKQQFAVRVVINDKSYADTLDSYNSRVKKGDLKSSTTSANGQNGTRFDGSFSKDIRGSAVVYKVRDKTLTLSTDADTFKPKFNELIKTLEFNT